MNYHLKILPIQLVITIILDYKTYSIREPAIYYFKIFDTIVKRVSTLLLSIIIIIWYTFKSALNALKLYILTTFVVKCIMWSSFMVLGYFNILHVCPVRYHVHMKSTKTIFHICSLQCRVIETNSGKVHSLIISQLLVRP